MKSKRVLTILLSMAIMLTFMPTLAFAQDGYDHDYDYSNAKVVKKATCTEYGLTEVSCEGEDVDTVDEHGEKLHLDCNAKVHSVVNPTHDWENVKLTKAEYIDELVAEGFTPAQISWYVTEYGDEYCYAYVLQCSGCGAYDLFDSFDEDGDLRGEADWQGHVAPKGTKACAETFECEECHEVVDNVYATAEHNYDDGKVIGRSMCGTGATDSGYTVTEFTCKVCGDKTYESVKNSQDGAEDHKDFLDAPVMTLADYNELTPTKQAAFLENEAPYLVDLKNYDGVVPGWYAPNAVNPAYEGYGPTCENGAENYGILVCGNCKHQLGNACAAKALGHDWVSYSREATCTTPATTFDICTVCGKTKNVKTTGEPTGHDYEVVKAVEPSVYEDGVTLIYCTKCGDENIGDDDYWITAEEGKDTSVKVAQTSPLAGYKMVTNSKYKDEKPVGDWYFMGFEGEFYDVSGDATKPSISKDAIKLDNWEMLEDHFGAYEDMAEATCTTPKLQGKKSTVTGEFYVHSIKTVGKPLGHETTEYKVDPTCGTAGYKYKTCSRCKLYVNEAEDKAREELVYEAGGGTRDLRYDFVDPVVSLGTPCSYEWVIVEEPTAAKDGSKEYKCSVCGDVAAVESIPYAGSKEEEAAKDAAIEAGVAAKNAADAKLAEGNLTDASAKAIKDAKAALETALTGGASADKIAEKTEALKTAVANAKTKAANKMTASANKLKVNRKKTKKFSAAKAFAVSGNAGAVSYSKVSGNKKISVSANGTVKVKKGLKKGKTYKVTVAVKDAGNGTTMGATQNVVLKVKVKKK